MINTATLGMVFKLSGAGVALGMLNQMRGDLEGNARSAQGAYQSYERLDAAMRSMLSREMALANKDLPITEAMENASVQSERLLKWSQRLAISREGFYARYSLIRRRNGA
jgi:ATP:corrinoid adenosyltransferase